MNYFLCVYVSICLTEHRMTCRWVSLSDAGVPGRKGKNVKTQGKDLWKESLSDFMKEISPWHPPKSQQRDFWTCFHPSNSGDMSLDLRGKSLSLPLSVQFEIPNTKHLAKDISPDLKWKCPVKDVESWSLNASRASPNCIRCNNWISLSDIAIDLT